MIRALTLLALALVSLPSPHASARSSATFLHSTSIGLPPAAQKKPPEMVMDDQKLARFQNQQQTAQQQLAASIRSLQEQLQRLEQMRASHPDSADLNSAISTLQARLNQLQEENAQLRQSQSTWDRQNSALAGTAKITALSEQTQRWTEISSEAAAQAKESSVLADKAVASLPPSGGGSTAEKPPNPVPPVDRSPASLPPPPPPPPPTHAHPPVHHDHTAAQPPAATAAEPPAAAEPHPPVEQEQPAPEPAHHAPTPPDEMHWFNQLKNGLLQYSVPQTMLWKVPSTVTVQISGEQAPPSGQIDNQTGQASIKVARQVRVLVSAPDNPNEFTIAPEADTQAEQYVPPDGSTTWHYSVTPRYTGTAQKLVVQAWVVYNGDTQRELPVYRAPITVNVPSFFECVKLLIEGDPDYWLKYGLPGGAGFIFISGIVVGLWKWAKKKKDHTPEPVNR